MSNFNLSNAASHCIYTNKLRIFSTLKNSVYALIGLFIYGCSVGPNYDENIREVSLKLDALSKQEETSGATIKDLKDKLQLFSTEISTTSTKIPAGGEREKVVRAYYDSASNYINKKEKWLDAMTSASVAKDRFERRNSPDCYGYSSPLNTMSCLTKWQAQREENVKEFEKAVSKFKEAKNAVQESAKALISARDAAHLLITKGKEPNMDAFNQLMIKTQKQEE